jgi:hypothetical protein
MVLASSQCDVLRKYSSEAGNGTRSVRNDTTGWRLELARSTSLSTCGEPAALWERINTMILVESMARTIASA